MPLASGAAIVLSARESALDPERLSRDLASQSITIMQATPVTWRMLLESGWTGKAGLRALSGGEALDTGLAKRLSGSVDALWNMYGPTETTIYSTVACMIKGEEIETSVVPIGRPISNTWIYILDAESAPVPMGVPGEIYIGGDGVVRGYLNRSELTAERFVKDPFRGAYGARMYKTGDLGRWREDGTIEYLGRNDFQVKIRGLRIELGEIEARLMELPEVQEVVVLAREDRPGDKRLVAYWTTRKDTEEENVPDAAKLRAYLAMELPAYMVPSAFLKLEEIPLTPNGKVDRNALPRPLGGSMDVRAGEAPLTVTENSIAEIWKSVLGVARVGRHDSFFDIGGNSLLLVQLMVRMKKSGMEMTLSDMLTGMTVEKMASSIEGGVGKNVSTDRIVCLKNGNGVPLFIIHELSGDVLSYVPLVNMLEFPGAVYGINALAFNESDAVLSSIESLSAYYVELIRSVQDRGPYRLAGWCAAGGIAMEMARIINERGGVVDFVGLIDSGVKRKFGDEMRIGRNGILLSFMRYLHPDLSKAEMDFLESITNFDALLDECVKRSLIPDGYDVEEIRHRVLIQEVLGGAWNFHETKYIPENTHLYAASDFEEDGTRLLDTWDDFEGSRPDIEVIGGSHYSIMLPPNVERIAAHMSEALLQCADRDGSV